MDGTAVDHLVRVGSFAMSGAAATDVACTLGVECSFAITGVGLATTNAVALLLDTAACGASANGTAFYRSPLAERALPDTYSVAESARAHRYYSD